MQCQGSDQRGAERPLRSTRKLQGTLADAASHLLSDGVGIAGGLPSLREWLCLLVSLPWRPKCEVMQLFILRHTWCWSPGLRQVLREGRVFLRRTLVSSFFCLPVGWNFSLGRAAAILSSGVNQHARSAGPCHRVLFVIELSPVGKSEG